MEMKKSSLYVLSAAVLGLCALLGSLCLHGAAIRIHLWEENVRKIQEKTYQTYFPVFSFVEENAGRRADAGFWEVLFGERMLLYAYAEKHTALPVQAKKGTLIQELTEGLEADEDMIEAVKQENEGVDFAKEEETEEAQDSFVQAQKKVSIDRDALDFETLISEYYAVDSTTYIGRDQLNAAKMSEADMTMKQDASKPQILIYHTHSQEAFADSAAGDETTSIMGAGERLAQLLSEKYGFSVIHHLGKYDVESRDYAYSAAAPALEEILLENPSIEVIIDLHRDQMPEETRLVTQVGGKPTARFMFFNGLSRTNKTGEIDYLQNPNLNANLAFSFQMQMAAGEYYPGLTRKVYLKGYRYNMHYREKTLLIELGAQNNTVEEIMNACEPLAHILWLVLSGEA